MLSRNGKMFDSMSMGAPPVALHENASVLVYLKRGRGVLLFSLWDTVKKLSGLI